MNWNFPLISKLKQTLTLQMYGEAGGDTGTLKDHYIVQGDPYFVGYDKIDLQRSDAFTIKFAYPTTLSVVVVLPGESPYGTIRTKKVREFKVHKNQLWRWSPTKAAAWQAYPGSDGIWLVQKPRMRY